MTLHPGNFSGFILVLSKVKDEYQDMKLEQSNKIMNFYIYTSTHAFH